MIRKIKKEGVDEGTVFRIVLSVLVALSAIVTAIVSLIF